MGPVNNCSYFFANIISPLSYGCKKGCLLSVILEMWIFTSPRHNEFLGSVVYTELMSVFSAIAKAIPSFVFKALQLFWCLLFEKWCIVTNTLRQGKTIIKKIKQKSEVKYFKKIKYVVFTKHLEMIACLMIESRIVLKTRVTIQILSVIQTDLCC